MRRAAPSGNALLSRRKRHKDMFMSRFGSSPRSVPFPALLAELAAAGEATRLRILCLLAGAELTVSELVAILGQSQPRVSRHLKLLAEAGLLERHREGSWVVFLISQ